MTNVIYFSLFCRNSKSLEYLSMLCYALETLEKYKTDKFDVVVFYTIPDINLKKHKFLGNYKIQKRFPWVKFLQSKYEDKDIHLHKWFNLKDVFALGYNNVFYLDCDIIFSKDPFYVFNRYKGNGIFHLIEGEDTAAYKVLGRAGAASGQWIINKDTFSLTSDLYNSIIKIRKELEFKAYEVLNKNEYKMFCSLSEQYAAQMALIDQGIESKLLSPQDVNWHNAYTWVVNAGNVEIKDLEKTAIIHYLGSNAHIVLPKRLLTDRLKHRRNELEGKL